jgi:hypothetical protein
MANPQDKTRKTTSTTGAATGSGTGAAQPKGAEANPTPSSGHDQGSRAAGAGSTTGAAQTGTGTTGTVNSQVGGGQSMSGRSGSSDQPIGEKVSETASGILDKAKETASGTYDAVATQATSKIEERKGELSSGLRTLADTFRKTGTDLKGTQQPTSLTNMTARYTGTAANQIEKVASYFERKDLKAMMRDTEQFARRNPAIFLGAAFALGMVAARFLKSSAPDGRASANAGSLNTPLPTALPPADQPTGAPRNM